MKAGEAQPAGDLAQFVEGVADGSVSIEDATSWLKAVHQHGMRTEDTVVLTKSMIASGASLFGAKARLWWTSTAPAV